MADRHPAWDQIEPEAQGLARHRDIIPGEHAIELSKAISLKRIADAIESVISPIYDAPAVRTRQD